MAIQIDLANLGDGGVRLLGGAAGDRAGAAVAGGSDVNGDGFLDIVIGAPDVGDQAGAAYVVFGSADGFANDIDLGNLGGDGLTLSGLPYSYGARYQTGSTVAMPGDVNGDNVGDVLVGNYGRFPGFTPAYSATEQSYLIFGDNGLPTTLAVDTLGTDGLVLQGSIQTAAGATVAGIGDIDSDGVADFAVGGRFATYIVHGDPGLAADVDLTTLGSLQIAGYSIDGGGDFNGDGIDDFTVGNPTFGFPGGFTSITVFGSTDRIVTDTSIRTLGDAGLLVQPPQDTDFGLSVAFLGDINNDGLDDVAAVWGSAVVGPEPHGATYVVYGSSELSGQRGVQNFSEIGFRLVDTYNATIAAAGDFNGDGIDDFLVGLPSNNVAYVVFGRDGNFQSSPNINALADKEAVRIVGVAGETDPGFPGDVVGGALTAIGDVNGDGFDDVLVGASRDDAAGENAGAAYIVYGFSTAAVSLAGTDAAETLEGFVNDDTLDGGGGDDTLLAGSGDDLVDGGAGDDTLLAGNGDDSVDGGDGDDSLEGGEGADTLVGGDGHDTLLGEDGNDTLMGDTGNDMLQAGGDDDSVGGGDGDDTGYGQDGGDLLNGDAGNDSLFGNLGDDSLSGGDDDDMVKGHVGDDAVMGDAGNDNLFGGGDDDTVDGGDGNDIVAGNSGADTVFGRDGDDTLRGQGGDDSLHGGTGNDLIVGMQGFDTLIGADGNDTLIGGAADDSLTGGNGIDAFVFAAGQGSDTITDFADGTDVISLVGVSGFADLIIAQTVFGVQVAFEPVPTTIITLTGITVAQLSADDFFFS